MRTARECQWTCALGSRAFWRTRRRVVDRLKRRWWTRPILLVQVRRRPAVGPPRGPGHRLGPERPGVDRWTARLHDRWPQRRRATLLGGLIWLRLACWQRPHQVGSLDFWCSVYNSFTSIFLALDYWLRTSYTTLIKVFITQQCLLRCFKTPQRH